MTQSTNILQELNELGSSLTDVASQNVYTVPEGYFDRLIVELMNRIKASEAKNPTEELSYLSPMLQDISKQMPYSVPTDYFEGLEEKLMQSIRDSSDYRDAKEELEAISPLLSGFKKKMPYSAPEGYFENLQQQVVTKTSKASEAKIISINTRRWIRYAAAAIVTGAIVLGGILYFAKPNDPVKSFAKFEKKLDKEIKTTSDKELAEFAQQFTDAGLSIQDKVQINSKEEVKDVLKDLSDKELKEFIKETADPDISNNESVPLN